MSQADGPKKKSVQYLQKYTACLKILTKITISFFVTLVIKVMRAQPAAPESVAVG